MIREKKPNLETIFSLLSVPLRLINVREFTFIFKSNIIFTQIIFYLCIYMYYIFAYI